MTLRTRQDASLLRTDIVLDGERYPLALASEGGAVRPVYEEGPFLDAGAGEGGQVVETLFEGAPAGVGVCRWTPGQPTGAISSTGDTTAKTFWRLAPTVTVTSGHLGTTGPVYFWERTGYIYAARGQYVARYPAGGGSVDYVQNLGLGATPGPAALFNGAWYVPAGDSVNAWKFTPGATDTWTQLTYKAHGFTITNQGAATVLVRAHSRNKVATSSDGATWGSDITVGSSDYLITHIRDSGVALFVAKEDNLYQIDTSGVAWALTRFKRADARYGTSLVVPSGSNAAFYNHGGLYLWDGQRALDVGPDALPENFPVAPNMSQVLRQLTGAVAYGSDRWVYALYGTYLLAGERIGPGQFLWHSLRTVSGGTDRAGLWVTGGGFLYTMRDGDLLITVIGPDGLPYPSNWLRGAASTSYEIVYPRTDMGLPTTLKRGLWAEVKVENWPATGVPTWQLDYSLDGGAFQTALSGQTGNASVSLPSLAWRDVIVRVTVTTPANWTISHDPRVRSVRLAAIASPWGARQVGFEIDTRLPLGNGATLRDPYQALAHIQGTERSVVTLVSPDGDTRQVYVKRVGASIIEGAPSHYRIRVEGVAMPS